MSLLEIKIHSTTPMLLKLLYIPPPLLRYSIALLRLRQTKVYSLLNSAGMKAIMARFARLVSRIVGVAGPGLVLFDVGLVLFVLAFLTTHLRLISRRYAHQLGLDDYTMAAATVSLTP